MNGTRARINSLKGTIEQLRKERAAQGLLEDDAAAQEVDPEEERAKAQIDVEKVNYKRGYAACSLLLAPCYYVPEVKLAGLIRNTILLRSGTRN